MNEEGQKLVTLLIAVSGLLLGLFNTWRLLDRDRVKLRLKSTQQTWGAALGNPSVEFSIRVENHGTFAVTIEGAGIVFEKAGVPEIVFGQTITRGEDTETHQLPLRVDSQQAITLSGGADDAAIQQCCPKYAYVRIASGVVIKAKIRAT